MHEAAHPIALGCTASTKHLTLPPLEHNLGATPVLPPPLAMRHIGRGPETGHRVNGVGIRIGIEITL